MNCYKTYLKIYLLLSNIFGCVVFSAHAQIRLDIEGDAKIQGKIELIQTVGDSSVFIGVNAGLNNDKTDNQNVLIGNGAGETNTSGHDNVYIGDKAGTADDGGSRNTFLGSKAGRKSYSSDKKTLLKWTEWKI